MFFSDLGELLVVLRKAGLIASDDDEMLLKY